MITVVLYGGAKKALGASQIEVGAGCKNVAGVLAELGRRAPGGQAGLEPANVLVAINGADSSVSGGQDAPIHDGDTVSVIPVIHGGAPRCRFSVNRTHGELFWMRPAKKDAGQMLDCLRQAHRSLLIQAAAADAVLGAGHARAVLAITLEAKKKKQLLSKRPETDLLMRLAGTGQISQAIDRAGIRPNKPYVVIAAGPSRALDSLYRRLSPDTTPVRPARRRVLAQAGITASQTRLVGGKSAPEMLLAERAATIF